MNENIEEIIDTSGFYKIDGSLLYGPNYVLNSAYELRRETKNDNTYPVGGWYWFDSESEARVFLGLPTKEEEEAALNSRA